MRDGATFVHAADSAVLSEHTTAASSAEAGGQQQGGGAQAWVLKSYEGDSGLVPFAGRWEAAELVRFVEERSLPLVAALDRDPRSRDVLRRLFESRAPKAMLLCDYAAAGAAELRAAFAAAAREHGSDGAMRFVSGDVAANEGALRFFGLTRASLPAVVVHDTAEERKYVLQGASPASLPEWLLKARAGELAPSVKSEEPPPHQDGPVKQLVARTFKELVLDARRDALLLVYAPWCGHCKALLPVWEAVGAHLAQHSPGLVVGKMDGTANDPADKRFAVKGYPTIAFYKAAAGTVEQYAGARDEQSLVAFATERAGPPPTQAAAHHEEL